MVLAQAVRVIDTRKPLPTVLGVADMTVASRSMEKQPMTHAIPR